MKNYYFYGWSQLKITDYSSFDIIYENPPSIKSKYTNRYLKSNDGNSKLKIDFVFGLGVIVALIILGGAQLYNSVKAQPLPINSQNKQVLTAKKKRNTNYVSVWYQLSFPNRDIELMTHRNAVAKGKF